MWPFRRKPRPRLHPGVRLRISVPAGCIIDADSSHLFYSARFAGAGISESCGPGCQPDCGRHGWYNLIPGAAADSFGVPIPGGEFSVVPLKIEIKPVQLFDA